MKLYYFDTVVSVSVYQSPSGSCNVWGVWLNLGECGKIKRKSKFVIVLEYQLMMTLLRGWPIMDLSYICKKKKYHYCHHHFWLAPLWVRSTTRNLQSGRFWAILTASVNVKLWDSRSFRTVFIHVTRGWPGGLFKSSGGSAVMIFLASALWSSRAMCPNMLW